MLYTQPQSVILLGRWAPTSAFRPLWLDLTTVALGGQPAELASRAARSDSVQLVLTPAGWCLQAGCRLSSLFLQLQARSTLVVGAFEVAQGWERRRKASSAAARIASTRTVAAPGMITHRLPTNVAWAPAPHTTSVGPCNPRPAARSAVGALDLGFFFPAAFWRKAPVSAGALARKRSRHTAPSWRASGLGLARRLSRVDALRHARHAQARTLAALRREATGGGRRRRLMPTPTPWRFAGFRVRRRLSSLLPRRRGFRGYGRGLAPNWRVSRRRVSGWLRPSRHGRVGLARPAVSAPLTALSALATLAPRRGSGRGAAHGAPAPHVIGAGGILAAQTPGSRLYSQTESLANLVFRFKQPQVRYRPGLSTHWRGYRRVFQTQIQGAWGRRQKRLTTYVARLRRVAAFSYLALTQMTVAATMGFSRLAPLGERGAAFATFGLVALNGVAVTNPLAQVYAGDVLVAALPAVAPVTPITYSGAGAVADAPAHLEVDELTLSVTLLPRRPYVGAVGADHGRCVPFLTLKCYNWKYVT